MRRRRRCPERGSCSVRGGRRAGSELLLAPTLATRVALRRHLLEVLAEQAECRADPGEQHRQSDPPVPDVGGKHVGQRSDPGDALPKFALPKLTTTRDHRERRDATAVLGVLGWVCRAGCTRLGGSDDAVAVEVGVETHLDSTEQSRWHLVGAALAPNRDLQFCLEVERLEAVHARVQVQVDVWRARRREAPRRGRRRVLGWFRCSSPCVCPVRVSCRRPRCRDDG